MKFKIVLSFVFLALIAGSCKIVFSGYDPIVDDTTTKVKRDFNVFFIKLTRAINTPNDPNDQKFENFQDYYDNMEVDIKILNDRSSSLAKNAGIVKNEIQNIQTLMFDFRDRHKSPGFKDLSPPTVTDDHHTDSNNINIAIDALLKLQEELKSTGDVKK